MKRILMYSELKPEKVQDYIKLHENPWPELMEVLDKHHIHNYSISMLGNKVFTFYEYTGKDYKADMADLDESPVMHRWWVYSKPCFLHHEEGKYYDDLTEVFYKE